MANRETMLSYLGKGGHAEYERYHPEEEASEDLYPKLEILSCPAVAAKKLVVISGTMEDAAEREPHLFINQKEISVRGGKWLTSIPIAEGANRFVIFATNNTGCTVFTHRDVFCGILPPRLELDPVPEITYKSLVIVTGTVSDLNPGAAGMPEVSVNGRAIQVDEKGRFSFRIDAVDGENAFTVTAKNASKIAASVRRSFIKAPGAPELIFTEPADTSPTSLPMAHGTIKPANDGRPCELRLNNQKITIGEDGSFSVRLKLKQNNAPTVFTVTGDKAYTVNKQVNFTPPPPSNTILKCEPGHRKGAYKITGTATDENGSIAAVTLNGKDSHISTGAWNIIFGVKVGFNPIEIITVNSFGKSFRMYGCVYIEAVPPVIKITDCPETVKAANVTISGTVTDADSEDPPVLFVNDYPATLVGNTWKMEIGLTQGQNPVTVIAKSSTGKTAKVEASVECTLSTPVLKVLNCPATADSPNLTIRGFARGGFSDAQAPVKVYVNGKPAPFSDGKWTYDVILKPGQNKFVIAAENDDGVRIEAERTVTLKS